ncbi:helix-turn-helix transcriptional regulator [Serratia quinivorans]|uniref:helix-turn-helix transcriptional regulator n=1 Tax=Serratia quinivorans TaxID=137545 RepID=UPI002178CB18|nr:AlpA family phage regulatory protein [Serratia quinivorans]CAI0968543.1 Predicted transcriptional regulator [Serratia quinivorans]CAI2150484.1 Predicted transcriptional regulator [Serratia quinivorans]
MSEQVLREKDVIRKLSVSRDLFRYLLESDQFPAPFDISGRGAIGWREAEVDEWIIKQSKAKRRAAVIANRAFQKGDAKEHDGGISSALTLLSGSLV